MRGFHRTRTTPGDDEIPKGRETAGDLGDEHVGSAASVETVTTHERHDSAIGDPFVQRGRDGVVV